MATHSSNLFVSIPVFNLFQSTSKQVMMRESDDDLHGGQRSTEVIGSKLCYMTTKLGQKNP